MPESLESSLDNATNALANSGGGMSDYSAPSSPGQKAEEAEATIPDSGAVTGEEPSSLSATPSPAASPPTGDDLVDIGGIKIPLSELVKWAGGQPTDATAQPSSPAAAPVASPVQQAPVDPIAALVARFDAIEQKLAAVGQTPAAQAPQQAQQQFLDPRTDPQSWARARNEVYRQHAKRDATQQELEMDLLKASAHLDRKEFQEMRSGFTGAMKTAQLQTQATELKNRIEGLVKTKFQNLDNEPGQRLLNAFLAEAAGRGEKDVEKVTQEASEFLPKFIVAAYAKRKSANLRALSGNMPRPGGTKAPAKPSFGGGFDAIDKATDAWVKSGRA